jgi:hypothetical protein
LPASQTICSKVTFVFVKNIIIFVVVVVADKPFFFVAAHQNSVGVGPASEGLRLRTIEYIPSGPPTSVQWTALSPTSATVTWAPPAPEDQEGAIVAYTLCAETIGRKKTPFGG